MNKPKLPIYAGKSQISGLKYVSPKEYEFFSYPYVLLEPLTHSTNNKTKAKFLNEVLNEFLSNQTNTSIGDYEVIVGDLNEFNGYGEDKNHVNILDALKSVRNYSWFMVEDFTIATPSDFISYFPYSDFKNNENFINYFSNKSLYPQIVSQRREEYDMEEQYLQTMSEKIQHSLSFSEPILFTGDRFFNLNKEVSPLLYISALGFLKNPGVYELKIDTANKLPALALLNQSFEKGNKTGTLVTDILDGSFFNNEFIDVGTVLRSYGRVECLVEKDGSPPQFMEVAKDEMFIIPLEKNETARVSISTGKLGKIEKKITGGDIGFIIDTRLKESNQFNPEWVEVFEERPVSF